MSQDMINNRFLEESVFAIADGYCVINLTKNIVRGSMYQVVNGKKYNLNEQLGLPENSSLQSLVDAWALTIPEEGLKDFLHEFDGHWKNQTESMRSFWKKRKSIRL